VTLSGRGLPHSLTLRDFLGCQVLHFVSAKTTCLGTESARHQRKSLKFMGFLGKIPPGGVAEMCSKKD
jgi:hypothetical protein